MCSLTLDRLTVRHGSGFTLGPLSLTGPADRPWVILGPPASGKTTLLRLLSGRLRPHGGSCSGLPSPRRRAYIPQFPERVLAGRNIAEDLCGEIRPSAAVRTRLRDRLDRVGLKVPLSRANRTLSAGERRRLALALGLSGDFEFLAVDEPDAGLDHSGSSRLIRIFAKLGTTGLVLATHRWRPYLGLNPFFLVLEEGQAVAQGGAETLSRKKVVKLLGEDRTPRLRFMAALENHGKNRPANVQQTLRNLGVTIAQVQEILEDTRVGS